MIRSAESFENCDRGRSTCDGGSLAEKCESLRECRSFEEPPPESCALIRFTVQLLSLRLVLYGPPVFALQEIVGERQAAEARLQAETGEKAREQARIEPGIAEHLDDLDGSLSTTLVPPKRLEPALVAETADPSKRRARISATPISVALSSTVFAVQVPADRPTHHRPRASIPARTAPGRSARPPDRLPSPKPIWTRFRSCRRGT